MSEAVAIENGFAVVGAGAWLAGRGQPAAFLGEAALRRRRGWLLRDRSALNLVETTGRAWFADAARPFLTHIPCAAPLSAVSSKVLIAPAAAWAGAELLKIIPMSVKGGLGVSKFGNLESTTPPNVQTPKHPNFIIMATASRTTRIVVEDGGTLSVRPEAVVAWTGNRPTGFVRKLGLLDVILPRKPRNLLLHFHGPCVVWVEGASGGLRANRPTNMPQRRAF